MARNGDKMLTLAEDGISFPNYTAVHTMAGPAPIDN
jgi:hypothetical protein